MEWKNPPPVNYPYFAFFFSILILLAASSVFTKENLGGSQLFFFLYAFGQASLEIALLAGLSLFIPRYLGKIPFYLFIGTTFTLLVLHLFDFVMDRILDLSIWEALSVFIFDETWENFIYLLEASGISLWLWILFFVLLFSLPLLGIFFYRMAEIVARKKECPIGWSSLLQVFIYIPAALLFWDFSASKVIHPDAYTAFIKSLPWKFTFLAPENVFLPLENPIRPPLSEEEVTHAIQNDRSVLERKPNIYLLIAESLREDSITSEIAPHLDEFKKNSIHFERAISNGNGTHLSWFSIFHSQFPYRWKEFQTRWTMGSPPLNLLKKWGYQIRLYTSAELGYYGMEKLLFGQAGQILDAKEEFPHPSPINPAEADRAVLAKLQKDLEEDPKLHSGQVFLIFWDCTHFDYSWPKYWNPKFVPFAQEFAYFQAFHSEKTIRSIKNRYYNAVNYMDSLFADFLSHLPQRDEAIVIFTGDHGEEFFEHGHLFHNSHLTREQTHIPLYMKFGLQERKSIPRGVVSQMDIFPSILDYLTGSPPSFLEGHSIFQPFEPCYALTARFNAGRTPYQFSIHNGKNKLIAQFPNRTEISAQKELQIISLRTDEDRTVHEELVGEWVDAEFGPIFKELCPDPLPF